MADEPRKIIVDDDWKSEAKREKERLAAETARQDAPPPSFAELLNLIVMQILAGLGALPTPEGQRIPPNLEMAKHFIDLLQVLEDKTKGNLTPEEKGLLDQVLYEMRMTFVQLASGRGAAGAVNPPSPPLAPH